TLDARGTAAMEARPRKSDEIVRVDAPAETIEAAVESVEAPVARQGPSRRTLVAGAAALGVGLAGAGWVFCAGGQRIDRCCLCRSRQHQCRTQGRRADCGDSGSR